MIPRSPTAQQAVPTESQRQQPTAWQFRLSSLLWLTFTAAMVLAYGRVFGERVMLVLVAIALVGAGIGVLIGGISPGRRGDALYWAIIGATLGCICVVPANVPEFVFWFWPLLGAIVGACAGARQYALAGASALVLAMLLGVSSWRPVVPPGFVVDEFLVDLACVPLAALALCGLVPLVDWMRAKYHTRRDAWAAGILFAVIAGNLWAAHLSGRL